MVRATIEPVPRPGSVAGPPADEHGGAGSRDTDRSPPGREPIRLDRGGFGLAGMAERVAALDGGLRAGPSGPGVWTVSARLPIGVRG